MAIETTSTTLTKLISTGLLNNEYPGESSTTYECRMFRHTIKTLEAVDFVKTLKWELEGNIPVELKIDNNGVISGHIDILDYQPACQGQVSSQEKMKVDGSNWSAGRFQGSSFRFNMVVKWTFEYQIAAPPSEGSTPTSKATTPSKPGDAEEPKVEIATLQSDVYIDVYLDNDISNLIFCRRYLEAEESIIEGPVLEEDRIQKHYFNINGKNYTIKEFQEFLKVHPGPFGNCKIKAI